MKLRTRKFLAGLLSLGLLLQAASPLRALAAQLQLLLLAAQQSGGRLRDRYPGDPAQHPARGRSHPRKPRPAGTAGVE